MAPRQDSGVRAWREELIIVNKREILPEEGEAIFHRERHEVLLPNARPANDLSEPSTPECNCQFAEISPAIRQRPRTLQRKASARRSRPSPPLSTRRFAAGTGAGRLTRWAQRIQMTTPQQRWLQKSSPARGDLSLRYPLSEHRRAPGCPIPATSPGGPMTSRN